jgi:hypothetical protein
MDQANPLNTLYAQTAVCTSCLRPVGPGDHYVNWKQLAEDNVEALNRTAGRIKGLEKRLTDKDEVHVAERRQFAEELQAKDRMIAEVSAGQQMVTRAEYERVSEANAKLVLKLKATQQFAERQRKLNVRWQAGAVEAMAATSLIRDLMLEVAGTMSTVATPPTTSAGVVG